MIKVNLIQVRGKNFLAHFVRLRTDEWNSQSSKHGDQRLGNLIGIDGRMRIGRLDLAESGSDRQQAVRVCGHLPQASDKPCALEGKGPRQIREILTLDNTDVLQPRNSRLAAMLAAQLR
jgi:hypothetical protein